MFSGRYRLFAKLDGQNTCEPQHLLAEATTGRVGQTSACLPTCWSLENIRNWGYMYKNNINVYNNSNKIEDLITLVSVL
jgi:hypothetical protein